MALIGLPELRAWLRDNPLPVMKNGKPTGKHTPRQCTASAAIPVDLYVDLVNLAASVPGSVDGDDLADGALARIVRRAVFVYVRPEADVVSWEADLEAARAEALALRGKLLGANARVNSKRLDLLEQLAASDPKIAAMLAELDTDS